MQQGKAIDKLVTITGASRDTVKRAVRSLREAGMLTTGARGVNAPPLTPLDVARLLIAFLADRVPGASAPAYVQEYGALSFSDADLTPPALSLEALRGVQPATFEAGLAALIEIYAFDTDSDAFREGGTTYRDGTFLPPHCFAELVLDPQPGAIISIHRRHESGWTYHFQGPPMSIDEGRKNDPRIAPLVSRAANLQEGAIAYMAEGFRK